MWSKNVHMYKLDSEKVSEAEVDVFLEFSCFFYDPMDVGNLISSSSAFSKPSLYIWKFSFHILLKSSLKDFVPNLTSMGNESNCTIVWTFFDIVFLWGCIENIFFQSCGHCWVFQIFWNIECTTLTSFFYDCK